MYIGAAGAGASSDAVGADAGVSSTVECLPVVHGDIERNSSNVRTRGLQHFQPVSHSERQTSLSTLALIFKMDRQLIPP